MEEKLEDSVKLMMVEVVEDKEELMVVNLVITEEVQKGRQRKLNGCRDNVGGEVEQGGIGGGCNDGGGEDEGLLTKSKRWRACRRRTRKHWYWW